MSSQGQKPPRTPADPHDVPYTLSLLSHLDSIPSPLSPPRTRTASHDSSSSSDLSPATQSTSHPPPPPPIILTTNTNTNISTSSHGRVSPDTLARRSMSPEDAQAMGWTLSGQSDGIERRGRYPAISRFLEESSGDRDAAAGSRRLEAEVGDAARDGSRPRRIPEEATYETRTRTNSQPTFTPFPIPRLPRSSRTLTPVDSDSDSSLATPNPYSPPLIPPDAPPMNPRPHPSIRLVRTSTEGSHGSDSSSGQTLLRSDTRAARHVEQQRQRALLTQQRQQRPREQQDQPPLAQLREEDESSPPTPIIFSPATTNPFADPSETSPSGYDGGSSAPTTPIPYDAEPSVPTPGWSPAMPSRSLARKENDEAEYGLARERLAGRQNGLPSGMVSPRHVGGLGLPGTGDGGQSPFWGLEYYTELKDEEDGQEESGELGKQGRGRNGGAVKGPNRSKSLLRDVLSGKWGRDATPSQRYGSTAAVQEMDKDLPPLPVLLKNDPPVPAPAPTPADMARNTSASTTLDSLRSLPMPNFIRQASFLRGLLGSRQQPPPPGPASRSTDTPAIHVEVDEQDLDEKDKSDWIGDDDDKLKMEMDRGASVDSIDADLRAQDKLHHLAPIKPLRIQRRSTPLKPASLTSQAGEKDRDDGGSLTGKPKALVVPSQQRGLVDPKVTNKFPRLGGGRRMKGVKRWSVFKWVLLVSVFSTFVYGLALIIWSMMLLSGTLPLSDVTMVSDPDIVSFTCVAAFLCLFNSLAGLTGTFLNSRPILAVYCLILWPNFISLALIGYTSYKRNALKLDLKLNQLWSVFLDDYERLRIQEGLHCCGYFTPFHEATYSRDCYPRTTLPGCKGRWFAFEHHTLSTFTTVAFLLMALHIVNITVAILCSNHVNNLFGKGMTPAQYRLRTTDVQASIMAKMDVAEPKSGSMRKKIKAVRVFAQDGLSLGNAEDQKQP